LTQILLREYTMWMRIEIIKKREYIQNIPINTYKVLEVLNINFNFAFFFVVFGHLSKFKQWIQLNFEKFYLWSDLENELIINYQVYMIHCFSLYYVKKKFFWLKYADF
jgi:hypothetical protein